MNKLILFLHGYGANGADLIGLKEYINNKEENIIFESPNAPEPCPLNYFGYQWFDLVERTPEEIFHGLKKSYSYLDKIITEMTSKHNIKTEQIMLIGFSQGAMISLDIMTEMIKVIKIYAIYFTTLTLLIALISA